VYEIITPNTKYCTFSFNIGPMVAIYTSIPIICYDIFLLVLVAILLVKHLKEMRDIKKKPNTYLIMIVRYHIIYFVSYVCIFYVFCRYTLTPSRNLTNQILMTISWTHAPV
jgi:hypothetical protein